MRTMSKAPKPMLAHVFDQYKDRVVYPVFVQPKLDGVRCVAVVERGSAI